MRIDINLASHPYEDLGRFWRQWGTALALLALTTVLFVFLAVNGYVRAAEDRKQISKLEATIAEYDREKERGEALLNQPQNRALRDQSRFLNALFQRKMFSWTRVFEDLERIMPAHVRVVSIHPDVASDNNVELRLVIGGDSREQGLDLVRKMEDSNRFRQTRIDQIKFANEQSTGTDRVQFDITALYVSSPQNGGETSGGAH